MIETVNALKSYTDVTADEEAVIDRVAQIYPWRITEYFASLMDHDDRNCPVRRQSVPVAEELDDTYGIVDPLSEEKNSPVPGIIRVYPDRIAVVVTSRCPVYCRHCLRKWYRRSNETDLRGDRLEAVVDYIRRDPTIRDVLLTGGDPLMLEDNELEAVLVKIRAISHVEIIRIGTRAPCTWPSRITESFVKMAACCHPLWVSTQFNHPAEITSESTKALNILTDNGIPVNNQSVLLRGVNDSVETMKQLVRKLVAVKVRPYYLYQAQTLTGTGHFVTAIETGLDIIKGLRGWTTGFAVPQYVLDTPYGKIPLNPEYLSGRNGDYVEMDDFRGRTWKEWNPLHR